MRYDIGRISKYLLLLSALTLPALMLSVPAQGQQYPSQNIRFICAFPPGSGSDILVRYLAEKIRPLTGENIIVENRPGAAGNIAMQHVARSEPNGYTIYIHAGSSAALSMHLFKNPPVDVPKELTIAATINRQPYTLFVDAKSPYKTLSELTAAMKAKGDKASYGAPQAVATIVGELYKVHTGTKAVEVNFKVPTDILPDLSSGNIDFASADPVFSLAQARAGRIRILALTTGSRVNAASELPTMAEQGVPMDITGWWAAMVPSGTPKDIVAQINKWFVQVVGSDETKAFLAQYGGDPLIETPEQGQLRLVKDIENWGQWVRAAKITPR